MTKWVPESVPLAFPSLRSAGWPVYVVLVGGANGDLDVLELIDGRS